MHEMSLAIGIGEIVRGELARRPGTTVTRVGIGIGEFAGVDPACLQACLEFVFQEAPAIGAELVFETVPAQARCRQCAQTFPPRRADFRCPHCGTPDTELLQGQSSCVAWMEVE